jgi:hypothetical protein
VTPANYVTMPFASPHPSISALATFPSLRTLRLWIEVPIKESVFQAAVTGSASPPLREDKLVQTVGNIYILLKNADPSLELDWLDVAFTRLDSWDRQSSYPRFLPVRLVPENHSGTGAQHVHDSTATGFTITVGEWQEDYAERDVYDFFERTVGHIY